MDLFFEPIAALMTTAVQPITGVKVGTSELETPPDRKLGDIAFPCFRLAKLARKAPPVLAKEIADQLLGKSAEFPEVFKNFNVVNVGPYVNFTLKPESAWSAVLSGILASDAKPGELAQNSKPTWVFEFSSPNVAKPFQIYHLRTTIVGATLSRIAKLRGYKVIRINHLGDWGTQYGKLAVGLEKYKDTLPAVLTLADLVRVYVQIHKDMETDPTLLVRGQENFHKLENGDAHMTAIWKSCIDVSLKEFQKVYDTFQVEFDHVWGESFYQSQMAPLTDNLRKKGIMVESEGAWVVPVTTRDGKEIPPCILIKKDGSSIYATRDLAAAVYRHEKFHFDRMTYVVGKEQILHFEQLFGALRAMGAPWESRCEHLPLGMYMFGGGKMSTRKGNFVTLDEVLTACREKSLELMRARETSDADLDIATIADQVAIGALVFADLSTDPTKDLEFDIERVISFEGETGPYLQYAHTRCKSIVRKAEAESLLAPPAPGDFVHLNSEPELFLIKQLLRMPIALDRVLTTRKPSGLASYLVDLVQDFNLFYRECKVLDAAAPEQTRARLALVQATQKVLALGLDLLGIPKPERM